MHVYPANALQKLDFQFILKELEHLCAGSLGKNKLMHSVFIHDFDILQKELNYVKEYKELIENDKALPEYGFNELLFLQKLTIENYYLDVKELKELYVALSSMNEIVRYFSTNSRQLTYPSLAELINKSNFENSILQTISEVIDIEKEFVKETASLDLTKIRKKIRDKTIEINAVFRRVAQQYKTQNFLAETEETIRDGRRVLSVLSEYKRKIKGLITDESENGNITYIEPDETLFLNNDLSELYLDDKREVRKILIKLSGKIKPLKEHIDDMQSRLTQIDIIRAKAYFAVNYNCAMPKLSKERILFLKDFVHPVLYYHHKKNKKNIVENTLLLDEKNKMLVISGPNAGGKSVVLKSVGIIQLMLQFGMLIPANSESIVSVYDKLFVDIGDEQSIENDLSTYSSHLTNMKYFLSNANSNTLVLIDEMGMGTDPSFGGPMAESVLESLLAKNIFGIITTHFNNIKIFAANTSNVQCGAMAFDANLLQPLYQLQIGQPGSSFTFEIAKKSGLNKHIIENAKCKLGDNKKVLDDVLSDIQTEKHFIKGLRKNVQNKESQLQDLTKSYEKLNKELEKEKKRILKNFEAQLLEKFNVESRNLENEMRAWKEDKNDKQKFINVRNYIDDNRAHIEKKLDESVKDDLIKSNDLIQIGSTVKLDGGVETGKVIAIKNKTVVVEFGSVHSKVNIATLQLVDIQPIKDTAKKSSYNSKIILEKSEFDYNLDIRGLMKDEAITALDNFMDKAVMYGMHTIKVIHGKGTGALRQTVQHCLKKYSFVKQFKYESDQLGGDGITVVELK